MALLTPFYPSITMPWILSTYGVGDEMHISGTKLVYYPLW